MTMQPVTTNNGGQKPYSRRVTGHIKGNYHRIHEALLRLADKDGVFQSTKTTNAIMGQLGIGRSSASSAIFQWSDPTGRLGYRRVRLYTPRTGAATPPEGEERAQKPEADDKSWAKKAFQPMPQSNKKGPFYVPGKSGHFRGQRRAQMLAELYKYQAKFRGDDFFWSLRPAVEHMAALGFNPGAVYRIIRDAVFHEGCEKKGWSRRLKSDYVTKAVESFDDLVPEQAPGGVEPEGVQTDVNTEAVNDPQPKPVVQPQFHAELPRDDLRQKVEALVESTLTAPETIRAIDKLVGEAIVASARRQLGLG